MHVRTQIRVFLIVMCVGLGVRSGNAQQFDRSHVPRGRFADPYLASHTWPGLAGNRGVSLFALVAQRRAALQEIRNEQLGEGGVEVSRSPYHQSRPGGSSAARYFGRSTLSERPIASSNSTHSDRYRHFFGRRGRESGR
jgi:hypothetical protein